eukprot:7284037-Alexandrium_andersonii.AAC.1
MVGGPTCAARSQRPSNSLATRWRRITRSQSQGRKGREDSEGGHPIAQLLAAWSSETHSWNADPAVPDAGRLAYTTFLSSSCVRPPSRAFPVA